MDRHIKYNLFELALSGLCLPVCQLGVYYEVKKV